MEITGLCNICGKPGKMHTCSFCGSIVCINCYNLNKGVCKSCETGNTHGVNKSFK